MWLCGWVVCCTPRSLGLLVGPFIPPPPSWLLQGKESRLSVELVFKLHQAVDPASDVDIDEVECILANLIYKVTNETSKSQASKQGWRWGASRA